MRIIDIACWEVLNVEGEWAYNGKSAPRDGSKICAHITNECCSCEIELLESRYLVCEAEETVVFGEAVSAFDRSLELALSVMNDEETALINIKLPRKFVDDNTDNDDITFTCQLSLKIIENAKLIFEYSPEEKMARAIRYKNLGVGLYKEGSFSKQVSAFFMFSQSVKWLVTINTEEAQSSLAEIKAIKMHCYNNLGLYHLRNSQYRLAVAATVTVLNEDPDNVKALYRRSVANTELQNYEKAAEDIQAALVLDPNNTLIKKQMEILKKRQKMLSHKYAEAMKKYFA
ncbi:peptidyl-prolyl cis-trans isomerase FKBP62-like [Penaeus chinensis]|uniref:peptidyl-prolyl cis-trans isomerase FKBP62-like n=1 Tax=Penaeus chinensis TaxID=139456 RepID=UPI001FB5B674|nr:peptidyl-prolyl cis-trans isomerase FKBP62-like [Penaeus chinensis]